MREGRPKARVVYNPGAGHAGGVRLDDILLGTANNVAAALGLNGLPPRDILKGLQQAQRRHLDVVSSEDRGVRSTSLNRRVLASSLTSSMPTARNRARACCAP